MNNPVIKDTEIVLPYFPHSQTPLMSCLHAANTLQEICFWVPMDEFFGCKFIKHYDCVRDLQFDLAMNHIEHTGVSHPHSSQLLLPWALGVKEQLEERLDGFTDEMLGAPLARWLI